MSAPRRKRFVRDKSYPPIRITERDRQIFELLRRYRFLTATQLTGLLGRAVAPSRTGVVRRAQKLYHHGYLGRLDAQRRAVTNEEYVHTLGRNGAAFLDLRLGRREFDRNDREFKYHSYRHQLLVNRVVVALEIAAHARADIAFLDLESILGEPLLPHPRPLTWEVQLPKKSRPAKVTPDAVFALRFTDSSGKYFFLEADRATMPAARSPLRQERREWHREARLSDIRDKLVKYAETYEQGAHRAAYPLIEHFQVLFVTTNRRRAEHMAHLAGEETRFRDYFLFTDIRALEQAHDPVASTWLNCRGQQYQLDT